MSAQATSWLKLRVKVDPHNREAVANFLFELGCCGCEERESELVAYFPEARSVPDVRREVAAYLTRLPALGLGRSRILAVERVEARDWNAEWRKHFKPVWVSPKLAVKPSWVPLQARQDVLVIEVDPKQAFGTGAHETTQLMLRLLEAYVRGGEAVLDVGTGTGILAIAAVRLGAKRAVALDKDEVAAEAAQENVEKNGVSPRVHVFAGELDALSPDARFDLILANLDKRTILRLLDRLGELLVQNGLLMLSGILVEELHRVEGAVGTASRLRISKRVEQGEWAALVLKKKEER